MPDAYPGTMSVVIEPRSAPSQASPASITPLADGPAMAAFVWKSASTTVSAATVIVHVGDDPEHAPPQFKKTESLLGVAVRVIESPTARPDWLARLQVVSQEIDPPVTRPEPSYDFSRVTVRPDTPPSGGVDEPELPQAARSRTTRQAVRRILPPYHGPPAASGYLWLHAPARGRGARPKRSGRGVVNPGGHSRWRSEVAQRFELVDGKSSKFWEVELVGSELHVAWGRIGTRGQSQVKPFADEATARAARDKLIATKKDKGYAAVGADTKDAPAKSPAAKSPAAKSPPAKSPAAKGPAAKTGRAAPTSPAPGSATSAGPIPQTPADDARPALPDEDTFVLPDAWARRVHPWRGRRSDGGATTLNGSSCYRKLHTQYVKMQPKVQAAFGRKTGRPDLLRRIDALLGTTETHVPDDVELEAAAAVVVAYPEADRRNKPAHIVDYWVAAAGYVFATDAALEALGFAMNIVYELGRPPEVTGPKWRKEDVTVLARLRELLAQADEADYLAARDAAAARRAGGDRIVRVATSYLFPTEQGWVEADVDLLSQGRTTDSREVALVASVMRFDQLERLGVIAQPRGIVVQTYGLPDWLPSVAAGLGAEAARACNVWLDTAYVDAATKRRLLECLAFIPSDEAMACLIDRLDEQYVLPALTEATDRFPRRALRLLGARTTDGGKVHDKARSLLEAVARRWPQAFDAVRPELPETAIAAVDAAAEAHARRPDAPAELLPKVLVSPAWTSGKKAPKAATVTGLHVLPYEARMTWEEGEEAAWAKRRAYYIPPGIKEWTPAKWKDMHQAIRTGKMRPFEAGQLLVLGPEDVARAALGDWVPGDPWHTRQWMASIVARHGIDALAPLTAFAASSLKDAVQFFGPFDAPALAPWAAQAHAGLKSARADAQAWLVRHPEAATVGLLPDAVGGWPSKARDTAEAALRFLAQHGHHDVVMAVARRYGEPAAAAVEQTLSMDPLDLLPAKMPTMPAFWNPSALPPPLLHDRSHQLPNAAIEHLGTMLAISPPGEAYAGLEIVKEACDGPSLARFAWALFEAWRAAGTPSKESWAFTALGVLGDDETARSLAPIIRKWPGEGGHARAVMGLDVLAAIGSDVALMHLFGIAQRVKFKALKERARDKIQEIARARDLTPEELADRLVPDLGLDEGGSMVLDYGERAFTVGFDEHLKPFVLDASGKPLKVLPKPGKQDDPDKAPAAYDAFGALKKDARTVAKDQLLRLELAMCGQRRWPASLFRQFFVAHPLLIHLVRRLVWATYDGDGRVEATFRVVEDSSFADANDEAFTLDESATVGIPHRLDLDGAVAARWGDVFGDYEILQPFVQLGRDIHAPTSDEKKATSIARVSGTTIPTGKVLGLETRGWRRGTPQDAGIVGWVEKELRGGHRAYLALEPGIFTGYIEESPEQKLGEVYVGSGDHVVWNHEGTVPIGDLDPVVFSELVRDLAQLTE